MDPGLGPAHASYVLGGRTRLALGLLDHALLAHLEHTAVLLVSSTVVDACSVSQARTTLGLG